jgi:adenosylcobinamide-GDP ribazoletransferase
MVFLPLIGLIIGIVLALCDRVLGNLMPRLAVSAIIVSLTVLMSGGLFSLGLARTAAAIIGRKSANRAPALDSRAIGAALLILIAEVLALAVLATAPARARALVLAMLLSRWAIVPIGYGLKPLEAAGLGISYRGGITFSEFGVSSVIALGLAMGLYDIVGLAAIVAVALTILGVRLLFSRRLGGVGGNSLAGGAAICELVTLAVLAAIARL